MKIKPIQLIPGSISCLRIVIGLAFPWIPLEWRLAAVVLGGLTDFLDGFASRLLKARSLWGRLLDPVADRIFLVLVVGTLLVEERLTWWQAILVGCRDIVVFTASIGLLLYKGWSQSARMQPRLLGKVTTGLQILFILALLADFPRLADVLLIPTALVGAAACVDYWSAFRAAPP